MTRNPNDGGSQTIQWNSITAVHEITRHRLSTARVERIIVTAFLRVLRLLLLLLRLRLRCLAGAALCAECFHCTVCSVFLFFLFSLSPPLPFRLCGSLRPCRHREPDSSTASCRPHVWSIVHTDPPCDSPPRHVSVRHIIIFLQ